MFSRAGRVIDSFILLDRASPKRWGLCEIWYKGGGHSLQFGEREIWVGWGLAVKEHPLTFLVLAYNSIAPCQSFLNAVWRGAGISTQSVPVRDVCGEFAGRDGIEQGGVCIVANCDLKGVRVDPLVVEE